MVKIFKMFYTLTLTARKLGLSQHGFNLNCKLLLGDFVHNLATQVSMYIALAGGRSSSTGRRSLV